MLVLEEGTAEEQAILDRELLGRFFEVQIVLNLVASLSTLKIATVQPLPEAVAGVGCQG